MWISRWYFWLLGVQMEVKKGADKDIKLISDISLTYVTKMEPFAVIFMKKR